MIRTATTSDCMMLAALSIKVWLATYAPNGIKKEYAHYVLSTFTESYFRNILNSSNYRLLVSESDNFVQGYVLINLESHYLGQSSGFEVEKLYIDSAYKRQGIGKRLLNAVTKEFGARYWLYTWVENESNGFYQHLGLKKIGCLTFNFYGHVIENNVYQAT